MKTLNFDSEHIKDAIVTLPGEDIGKSVLCSVGVVQDLKGQALCKGILIGALGAASVFALIELVTEKRKGKK